MVQIIGANPNKSIEDEYIHNLQQQMHFMEMELKLLKEKVIEEEKASGIGSLFNDEKTYGHHIDLIRVKYNQMRSDFMKKTDEMERERLRIMGDQFQLDAQINIMTDVNTRMEDIRDKDEKERLAKISDLEKQYRDLYKQRKELEDLIARLRADLDNRKKQNYEYILQLRKEDEADKHSAYRYDRDTQADLDRYNKKLEELEVVKAELEKVATQFAANPEYLATVEIIDKNRADIQVMYVDLQLLKCQVQDMEQTRDLYEKIKEQETKNKRDLIEKNCELKKEVDTKDQMERMRMQKRLNETKNPELRDVMVNTQVVTESITQLEGKLDEEKEKYDKLLNERLVLDRLLELMSHDTEKTNNTLTDQNAQIAELKGVTTELDKDVKGLETSEVNLKAENKEVENKYRRLAKTNVSLKAKLEFLLHNFDFSTNVKTLNIEDFRNLISSNDLVNQSIVQFVEKLSKNKDDVMRFEIEVEAKGGKI